MIKYMLLLGIGFVITFPLCGMQNDDRSSEKLYLKDQEIVQERFLGRCFWHQGLNQDLSDLVNNRIVKNLDINQPIGNHRCLGSPLFASVVDDARLKITKRLLRHGADPNLTVNKQIAWIGAPYATTSLLHAIEFCAVKTVKTLLKAGADPNIVKNLDGWTMLHAVYFFAYQTTNLNKIKKYVKISKLLLRYGADPNMRDVSGRTPLFLAVKHHEKSAVSFTRHLLLFGADPLIKDNTGSDVMGEAFDRPSQFLKDWQDGEIKLKKKIK